MLDITTVRCEARRAHYSTKQHLLDRAKEPDVTDTPSIRAEALRFALQSRSSRDTDDSILERAKSFEEFLSGSDQQSDQQRTKPEGDSDSAAAHRSVPRGVDFPTLNTSEVRRVLSDFRSGQATVEEATDRLNQRIIDQLF